MKERYYFPHDYDTESDPKIIAMKSQYSMAGYGMYWLLIESLHRTEDHKLPYKAYQFIAIAKQTDTTPDFVKQYLSDCIELYELFESDGVYFWSNRVLANFEKRGEISKKRSESGKMGALAKQNLANAKQDEANTSKGKEKKEKEKEISTDVDIKNPTSASDTDPPFLQANREALIQPIRAETTWEEARVEISESEKLRMWAKKKHEFTQEVFNQALDDFISSKEAVNDNPKSRSDVKANFQYWLPSWIGRQTKTTARDGPADQDLPEEVKIERQRRKSQYELRIAGSPHMANKPMEWTEHLSKYHVIKGLYHELRPETIQKL